jgi:DNA-binding MurR/RpiR family transcriptional regulator
MTLLEQIRKGYENMSPVDRRISNLIMDMPEEVVNMTTGYLAARGGVSEGSVINYANKLGLRGFSALKIQLARELESFAGFSFGSVLPKDSPSVALKKVSGNAVEAFQQTSRSLRNEDLKAAADALMSARCIDIYGAGDSALLAQNAYFQLMRIGIPAYAVTDYLTLSLSASHLCNECVAMAFSHSGQTIEVIDAMTVAKQQGAKTICITSYPDSLLAGICDISLVTYTNEAEQRQEAVISHMAQFLVLSSLCSYISAQLGAESMEQNELVHQHLSRHRYQR